MKIYYTFLFLSISGLMVSCSQNEKAEKSDESVIVSNLPTDSLKARITKTGITKTKEQASVEPVKEAEKLNLPSLDGIWVHEEDDQAFVTINGRNWVFGYEGEEATGEGKYQISKVDKLPQFIDPKVDAAFLVLSNKTDTLYYELNGVTEETLSLTYYPAMKTHLYKRKKTIAN
ncbi:MAG: hypothetical protein ACO1O1_06925 [Adhaeribacter sp.]